MKSKIFSKPRENSNLSEILQNLEIIPNMEDETCMSLVEFECTSPKHSKAWIPSSRWRPTNLNVPQDLDAFPTLPQHKLFDRSPKMEENYPLGQKREKKSPRPPPMDDSPSLLNPRIKEPGSPNLPQHSATHITISAKDFSTITISTKSTK